MGASNTAELLTELKYLEVVPAGHKASHSDA